MGAETFVTVYNVSGERFITRAPATMYVCLSFGYDPMKKSAMEILRESHDDNEQDGDQVYDHDGSDESVEIAEYMISMPRISLSLPDGSGRYAHLPTEAKYRYEPSLWATTPDDSRPSLPHHARPCRSTFVLGDWGFRGRHLWKGLLLRLHHIRSSTLYRSARDLREERIVTATSRVRVPISIFQEEADLERHWHYRSRSRARRTWETVKRDVRDRILLR